MNSSCIWSVVVALFAVTMSAAAAIDTPTADQPIATSFGQLPLAFEENLGQAPADTRFLARGPGYQVHVSSGAVAMAIAGHGKQETSILRMRLIGARADISGTGVDRLASTTNYFRGPDTAQPITNISNYSRVQFDEVYPGIGLAYYGNQRQLEFDWIVAADADPSQIQLQLSGVNAFHLDDSGDLVIDTGTGTMTQHHPVAYQSDGDVRHDIDSHFVLRDDGNIGIALGAYDHHQRLVIDPILSYSTFLGGSSNDYASAITVDSAGNAYVAGYTASSNFPLVSAYDKVLKSGTTEAFVSKLNPTGSALIYSTFLGGTSGSSYASGIAIDGSGNAYVTGTTTGSDFPVTTGAYQKGATGGGSFVVKLGATGSTLTYSTYVLKSTAAGIAVDGSGSAYITGGARSGFATTSGALQTATRSSTGTNAFILKLNATGTGASYSTFLGGSGNDSAAGIAVDSTGNAYIGGATTSTNFPLAHAYQSTLGSPQMGFVAKIAPAGNALAYSTYLGGSVNDRINAVAIDASGSVYVTGETYSFDFPIMPGAYLTTKPGYFLTNANASGTFVSKFSPAGDRLIYSTFLGGGYCSGWCSVYSLPPTTPGDVAYAIAVDSSGHAYVSGIARSPDFPLVDALPPRMKYVYGSQNEGAFVSKLSASGNALLYSTLSYVASTVPGGNTPTGQPYNAAIGVALDGNSNAYVASQGASDFSTTTGAYKTTNAGATDAAVFKLTRATTSVTLAASPNPATRGQTITLTASVPGGSSSGHVTFMYQGEDYSNRTLATVPLSNGVATYTTSNLSGILRVTALYRDANTDADSTSVDLVVNLPSMCN